jgi:hypothetical protein
VGARRQQVADDFERSDVAFDFADFVNVEQGGAISIVRAIPEVRGRVGVVQPDPRPQQKLHPDARADGPSGVRGQLALAKIGVERPLEHEPAVFGETTVQAHVPVRCEQLAYDVVQAIGFLLQLCLVLCHRWHWRRQERASHANEEPAQCSHRLSLRPWENVHEPGYGVRVRAGIGPSG